MFTQSLILDLLEKELQASPTFTKFDKISTNESKIKVVPLLAV